MHSERNARECFVHTSFRTRRTMIGFRTEYFKTRLDRSVALGRVALVARRNAGVRGFAIRGRRVEIAGTDCADPSADRNRPGAAEAARRVGPALVRADRVAPAPEH